MGGGRAKKSVFGKHFDLNSKLKNFNNFSSMERKFPTSSKNINQKNSKQKKLAGGVSYVVKESAGEIPL